MPVPNIGPDALAEELAALQRGRGIHEPRLATRLGPVLTHVVTALGSDTRTCGAPLTRELLLASDDLPLDLRTVFRLACGLTSEAPFLNQRLAEGVTIVDRGPRALRRRLKSANLVVAQALLARASRATRQDPPWFLVEQTISADFGKTPPTLSSRSAIRSLRNGVQTISNRVAVLGDDAPPPSIEVVHGGTLTGLVKESSRVWRCDIALSEPLTTTAPHELEMAYGIPSYAALHPALTLMPVRYCRRFRVSVDFGHPPCATAAWVLDGAMPYTVDDDDPRRRVADLRRNPLVDVEFHDLRIGMIYGVRWAWHPDVSPDARPLGPTPV